MIKTQKIIKYFALALAFTIILNIIHLGTFIIYSTSNILSLNKQTEVTNEITVLDNNLSSLKIDLDYADFKVIENDQFKIEYNKKNISWKLENGILVIKDKNQNWFKKNGKSNLIMYIPQELLFDMIDIDTGAGVIDIDILNTKDLFLNIGAGKGDFKNLNITNSAKIDAGLGKVQILAGKINDLNLGLGVGNFSISSVLTGQNNIKAGVGSLDINLIDGCENYKIKAEKGLGSITINGAKVQEDIPYGNGNSYIKVEGGLGSISIK